MGNRENFFAKEKKTQNKGGAVLTGPQDASWPEGLLIAFFGAFIILVVRLHVYERPMDQFYWNNSGNQIVDFFSYYKMILIILCGGIALLVILLRYVSKSMPFHQSYAYIPMGIYAFFIILSYLLSEQKQFALLGYNDRFEGTLPLLAYLVLLFFIINRINTEKDVRFWIVRPLAAASVLLSILGLSQALDHDFFRSEIGKKLITPSWFWPNIDSLNFTFQNKEIYQTVYNINYVSFYLTLLLPLFAMLFIRESRIRNKILLGGLFALLLYNLIGSKSSGGLMGIGVAVLFALLVLNRRLLTWWKSIIILLILTLAVGGVTYDRWLPEVSSAFRGLQSDPAAEEPATPSSPDSAALPRIGTERPYIDYFKTEANTVTVSMNGEPLVIEVTADALDGTLNTFLLTDKDGKGIDLIPSGQPGTYIINDARFMKYATVAYASDGTDYFMLLNTPEKQWAFKIEGDTLLHLNSLGKTTALAPVPAWGFENNQDFGSGRGYIWSRTFPMLKETIFVGHGADTYCLYFPQNDYAGKYNAGWNLNTIVDKPHNMYLGAAVGTGVLSVLALLALFGMYVIQSFRLYFHADFEKKFLPFAGAGIFFGICGFLATGLVDDSSVSTMPMFYTLLGTGIAVNRMLKTSQGRANRIV